MRSLLTRNGKEVDHWWTANTMIAITPVWSPRWTRGALPVGGCTSPQTEHPCGRQLVKMRLLDEFEIGALGRIGAAADEDGVVRWLYDALAFRVDER